MSFPPWSFFAGSATFHYLGPAFAVLLFSRVEPLGVAGLRIWSAALVFVLWRRPWRAFMRLDADGRRTVLAWGAVLAGMNAVFYLAIDRLPLGTVAAIEFLPVIALAALGARSARNLGALGAAVGGVYLLADVRLAGEPLGFVFAFANAALFAAYIVLAHRASRRLGTGGIDGLAAAMLVAGVVALPIGGVQAASALLDPVALAAGVGVGICSSVIPYVFDQLAMARLARATYALMVALLPAIAVLIGVVVLRQIPAVPEIIGVALVIGGVALHKSEDAETSKGGLAPNDADGHRGNASDENVTRRDCETSQAWADGTQGLADLPRDDELRRQIPPRMGAGRGRGRAHRAEGR